MLLALRSLWEAGGALVRRGAGLLLALQSLVEEQVAGSSDVTFNVTGVAASPAIGEISQVDGSTEQSSGGALRFALQQAARESRRKPRDVTFAIVRGIAANPQIGELAQIDIGIESEGGSAAPRAIAAIGNIIAFDSDFSLTGAGNRSPISRIQFIDTDFGIGEGVIASPVINSPELIETAFDLLEEEWMGLMLAA